MSIILVIAIIWTTIGIYYWVKMPKNEFSLFDFFIGLPLVILFWPRIKNK